MPDENWLVRVGLHIGTMLFVCVHVLLHHIEYGGMTVQVEVLERRLPHVTPLRLVNRQVHGRAIAYKCYELCDVFVI